MRQWRTRHTQRLSLEASLVIGILLVTLVTLLPQINLILTKARLVEVFGLLATARVDIMERMALTGEGISDQPLALNLRDGADENIEDFIGQKQTPASVIKLNAEAALGDKKRGKIKQLDQQSMDRLCKFEGQPVNDSIRVSGVLGNSRRPFSLTFNPSMNTNGPSGNILWLCGHQKPPAGWSTPLERAGADLPSALIFFVCR